MINRIFFTTCILLMSLFVFSQQVNNTNVLHYDINITEVDFLNDAITAHANIEFTVHEAASNMYLHLLHLDVDSVVSNGEHMSYSHNDTLLLILLGEHLSPGDARSLTVYYHGNPVTDPSGWGGFYFQDNYAFNLGVGFEDVPHNYGRVWFPCVDNFTDRATYKFNITTSVDHKAVCNGSLDSITTQIDGTDTTLIHHWTMIDEIPSYLASMAVGAYEVIEYDYQGIERDIPVQLYVYKGNTSSANGSFQNLDTILNCFENYFGPYPWQRVGYVAVPFNSGAMEHATNIAIGNGFINGSTTYEQLIAHELSHSWFGDFITCHDAEEMWINEGWATYCETLYRGFMNGENSAKIYRRKSHFAVLLEAHLDDGGFYPLNEVPQDVTYGTTSYEKGADVVHSLKAYLGDDFFPAVRNMLYEKALDDISSEEMRDILSDYTGTDLTEFFNSRVFDTGFPDYKLDSFNVVNNGSTFDVEVFVQQKSYGRDNFYDDNMVDICFMDENYEVVEKRMEFDGRFGSHTFSLDFNPILVMMDYFERWSDARIAMIRMIDNPGYVYFDQAVFRFYVESVTDSAFLRVTHHWVSPDQFKEPIPGLILADHRYWKIESDMPDGFSFDGNFKFSDSDVGAYPELDTEFITNSLDSLVLVYRTDAADDWHIVENQTLSTIQKRIDVEDVQPGEYSLAIYDWEVWEAGVEETKSKNRMFSVYPNPASGTVYMQTHGRFSGYIRIINNTGQVVFTQQVTPENGTITWNPDQSAGLFFVLFNRADGNCETRKLLITK
ncbi:MAG: M1 family aminopeptidase [Bacteroidota bacterium]|nr:M1 family aminopeptidase [Bacteroidota bacterium]